MDNWKTFSTKVEKVDGVHDLFFVFKCDNGELFNWIIGSLNKKRYYSGIKLFEHF